MIMTDDANTEKVVKAMALGENYSPDELSAMTATPQKTISRIIIALLFRGKIRVVGVGGLPRNRRYMKVIPHVELQKIPDHAFNYNRLH